MSEDWTERLFDHHVAKVFPKHARGALAEFNNTVCCSRQVPLHDARRLALRRMGGREYALLEAFCEIWPHWIHNGDWNNPRKACERILGRLEYDTSPGPQSTMRELAGMGMRIRSIGGRRTGAVSNTEGSGRGYRVKRECRNHPGVGSYALGICRNCYSRLLKWRAAGLITGDIPQKKVDAALALPGGRGNRKLLPRARKILGGEQ